MILIDLLRHGETQTPGRLLGRCGRRRGRGGGARCRSRLLGEGNERGHGQDGSGQQDGKRLHIGWGFLRRKTS